MQLTTALPEGLQYYGIMYSTTRVIGTAQRQIHGHSDVWKTTERDPGSKHEAIPSEPQLGRPLATSIRHLVPIVYLLQYPPRNANLDLLHRHSPSFFCRSFFSSSAPLFSSDSHQHACMNRSSENRWGEPFDYHLSTLGKPRAESTYSPTHRNANTATHRQVSLVVATLDVRIDSASCSILHHQRYLGRPHPLLLFSASLPSNL
jgi:hypothetical protein